MAKRGASLLDRKFIILLICAVLALSMTESVNAFPPIATGGGFSVFSHSQAIEGHGDDDDSGWKHRTVLGQLAIGNGIGGDYSADLGYVYMINFRPTFLTWIPAINAKDQPTAMVKHPYNNNTLVCEVNFTEYDVGDIVTVYFTWFRNSTKWYNNSFDVQYHNLSDLVTRENVPFEAWTTDNESVNLSSSSEINFTLNSTSDGNIESEDSEHFELWKCSVHLFDQYMWALNWVNSTPIMIYNHRPDYDSSMPTYYEWPEDTEYDIDLGSNFSDIDGDDINWYINWTSTTVGYGYIHPDNITIEIDNSTGNVHLTPDNNVTGYMYIIFTAADNNASHTSDWYLNNDYGHTNTSVFLLNITQVNDAPWATDVYIDPAEPSYLDNLTCDYTYNDLESNSENTSVTSYKWWIKDEGIGAWTEIADSNSSILTPDNFDLDDLIICSVRIKDIYYDWNNIDRSKWSGDDEPSWTGYTNSSYVAISIPSEAPDQEENIVIAIG